MGHDPLACGSFIPLVCVEFAAQYLKSHGNLYEATGYRTSYDGKTVFQLRRLKTARPSRQPTSFYVSLCGCPGSMLLRDGHGRPVRNLRRACEAATAQFGLDWSAVGNDLGGFTRQEYFRLLDAETGTGG